MLRMSALSVLSQSKLAELFVRKLSLFSLMTFVFTASVLSACGKQPGESAAPPPAKVVVETIKPQAVDIAIELPGRTQAYRVAEVRARVDGIVLKREFEEGSLVRAGQVLYRIDPAPYQAQVNTAKANLEQVQADVLAKKAQADRYQMLVASEAISKQAADDAIAAYKQALAAVAAAKAVLDNSQISLNYTVVTSPIAGRVGKSSVTEGAYVRAAEATSMTTVHQQDPIYVDVAQSMADLLKLKSDIAAGLVEQSADGSAPVTLRLENGAGYSGVGKLQFTDSTVDPGTGSVTLRALFANPDGVLMPGMFVHARLRQGVNSQALLLPQQAVSFDAKGSAQALFVNADNVVELRKIEVGRVIDGRYWLIVSGVVAGDRVVVEGVQKARPGATVAPQEAPASASQTRG